MLMRSHYKGIRFDRVAHGFPDEYSAEALDALTAEVQELVKRFANALVPTSDVRGNPVDSASTTKVSLISFCYRY